MGQTSERRTSPRYACLGQVFIDKGAGKAPLRCRLLDLSFGGCLIAPLEAARYLADSEIEFIIESGVTVFRVRGSVRRTNRENGAIGIRFLTLTSRGRTALEELIEELQQAKVPDLNQRPRYTFRDAAWEHSAASDTSTHLQTTG